LTALPFDAVTVAVSHVSEGSAKLGLLLQSEHTPFVRGAVDHAHFAVLSKGATYSTETLWPCIIGMAMPKRVELGRVHAQFARIAIVFVFATLSKRFFRCTLSIILTAIPFA